MKLRVFTTFSGYDSQLLALRRIGIEDDCIGWSEIDPHAIKAHDAIFPEYADLNYGDICKIDWNAVPDFDLLTYSSPCQDFSIAGLQQGGEKGSGTRSSLLWEVEKAIAIKRPQWLLMENVPALTTKTFMPLLRRWLDTLTRYGYTNYAKCLNAKDYGVPQSRNRLFVVSTLGKEPFFFPKKKRLEKRLCHVLEVDGVPENFYYTDAQLEGRFASKYKMRKYVQDAYGDKISRCILAHEGKEPLLLKVKEPQLQCVGSLKGGAWDARQESTRRVYSPDGISPTLNCCEGGGLQPKIIIKPPKNDTERIFTEQSETNTREVLRLLWKEIGKETVLRTVGGLNSFQKAEVLQSKMHEQSLRQKKGDKSEVPTSAPIGASNSGDGTKTAEVRDLRSDRREVRCSPFGWELSQQFIREFDACLSELPLKTTQAKRCVQYLRKADESTWLLRQTLSTLQEIRQPEYCARKSEQMIRRLTPTEAFRLMDVDDFYIDRIQAAGISNSQQYKLAGNSIVVAVLADIFRKMFVNRESETQQRELF